MAIMDRSQFSAALDAALRTALHNNRLKRKKPVYGSIFNIESSDRNKEYDRTFTGFLNIPEKPEGVRFEEDDMKQGYETIYTHLSYGLKASVTHEMLEDDLHGVMKKIPINMNIVLDKVVDLMGANVFNRAFNPTYLGGDGVVLCSAAHPLKKSGGTASNTLGAVDVSYSQIQAGITKMQETVDDSGIYVSMQPKILLIHPDNYWNVMKILNSPGEPDTANRNANTLSNQQLQVIVWSYLSDADAWFLLADKGEHQLKWYWREKPNTDTDYDKDVKAYLWYLYFRTICGWSDWRGVVGAAGSP